MTSGTAGAGRGGGGRGGVVAPGEGLLTLPTGILVAGAGPAGLVFALQAHDHGAGVRVIERRHEAFWGEAATGPIPALLRSKLAPSQASSPPGSI